MSNWWGTVHVQEIVKETTDEFVAKNISEGGLYISSYVSTISLPPIKRCPFLISLRIIAFYKVYTKISPDLLGLCPWRTTHIIYNHIN